MKLLHNQILIVEFFIHEFEIIDQKFAQLCTGLRNFAQVSLSVPYKRTHSELVHSSLTRYHLGLALDLLALRSQSPYPWTNVGCSQIQTLIVCRLAALVFLIRIWEEREIDYSFSNLSYI